MTFRIFILVLLFGTLLTGGLMPPRSCSAEELSLAEKEELLDKAQAALIWFHSLGNEIAQNRTAPEKYREQISPMELIQAAAVLHSYRENEQTALAEQLLLMLPLYRTTPEENFELNDLLGDAALKNLSEIRTDFLEKLPVEAEAFRTGTLNNAEKIVLHQEPATALELMKAVDVLSIVGRPVLVRHYLRKLLSGNQYEATPEEAAKIVETLGTQKLMQLAIHPDFVPLGKEAVAKIIDEAKKHWQDEEKIAEALKETNWFMDDPNTPQVRREAVPALQVLWKGEQLSVRQVFEKLKTIEDERDADELTAVLLSLRQDMKEALAAALYYADDDSTLRYHAARGLAVSVSPQESFLLYLFLFNDDVAESEKETVMNILKQRKITVPSREQAAAILYERGNDYFERRRPLRIDADGKVSFWVLYTYDAFHHLRSVEYRSLENIEAAYLYFASTYYFQSYVILPKTSANAKAYKHAFFITNWEYMETGSDFGIISLPYSENVLKTLDINGSKETEQLLQISLEKNCFSSAICAIEMLKGYSGEFTVSGEFVHVHKENIDLLQSTNGKPRLLVQAVTAQDRRVRFEALKTIMFLNPTEPFAGSSLVADALVWFSKSEGQSVILSGHPQMAVANQTASLFLGLGYQTDVAVTCRELFQRAADSPDVELVVVDARTPSPPVGEFVQKMRQDARTAQIPIAILGGSERDLNPNVTAVRRNAMTRFDRRNPDSPFRTSLSLTYPRLASGESAKWVRDDLLEKTGADIVSPDIRLEQARQALGWLRDIKEAELESSVKIYHFDDFDSVVLDALHSERRVSEGLALAEVVKSAAVQSAIYELAANVIYPMELRQRAGNAFENSVDRFGVLLRGAQIQRLYDRYNQSEHEPKESQELLSRLIDAVEEKVNPSRQR